MAHPIFASEFDMDILPVPKLSIKSWPSSLTPSNIEKLKKTEEFMEQNHSGRVTKAFKPIRMVLLALGRSPFVPLVKKVKSKKSSTGTGSIIAYEPSMKSPQWLYFLSTSFILATVLVLSTLGFADHFLSWNFILTIPWTEEEKKIFRTNLVPFVLFWSCLVHSVVGNVSFVINRKSITQYINNWNIAVDVLDIHVPSSLTKFVMSTNLGFFGFLIIILSFYVFGLVPLVHGGSALIGMLTFRPFFGTPYDESFWEIPAFGIFILLYAIYSSRSQLLVFSFMTRLLRHCFKVWNQRLTDELQLSPCDKRSGSSVERMACEKLYKDHFRLTKLVKQTDKAFGTVLQSYYASQILNMCFELYYLARSGIKGSFGNEAESKMDIVASVILLVQNIYLFLTVSLDAAYVGEEAMKGFDVVRARGLHREDSVSKKYLIYSLQVSYSQRIVITGGKYFALDRPFIVSVLGAVFTYFVIILQFGPSIRSSSPGT